MNDVFFPEHKGDKISVSATKSTKDFKVTLSYNGKNITLDLGRSQVFGSMYVAPEQAQDWDAGRSLMLSISRFDAKRFGLIK